MDSYIQAAEQIKEDVLAEYINSYPDLAGQNPYNSKPNVPRVLDNIEIVFRNSAKQKVFSERIRGMLRSKLDGEDILPAYLTTQDNESYNDSLDSIACSKKICFFLFTSRYKGFGLVERTKYTEILRKQETICPHKNIDIYNLKKALVDLMVDGYPSYQKIQPILGDYIQALRDLLVAQGKIYKCEADLMRIFSECMEEISQLSLDQEKPKLNPVSLKAMLQVLLELRKRGLNIPEIKSSFKNVSLESILAEMKEHHQNLLEECEMIGDVTAFLDEVIMYMEKARQAEVKKAQEAEKEVDSNETVFDSLSAKFKDWISR